jgi:hypothetical protein
LILATHSKKILPQLQGETGGKMTSFAAGNWLTIDQNLTIWWCSAQKKDFLGTCLIVCLGKNNYKRWLCQCYGGYENTA